MQKKKSATADAQPAVKKIQPYPIELLIGANPPKKRADIKKLTQVGFICDLKQIVVKVAEEYPIEFTIPATWETIKATAKVIKTYDQFVGKAEGAPGSVAARLAEFHFVDLKEPFQEYIKKFLVNIKQF